MGADEYASYVSKTANNELKIAVIDTGVSSHTFLKGRNACGGYDFVDNDSNHEGVYTPTKITVA